MNPPKYSIGVDWAKSDGDKTSLAIARYDGDVVTLVDVLRGETAEYIAGIVERQKTLVAMVLRAYEACHGEYMDCPWCSGHIGHDNEWHDEWCLFPKEFPQGPRLTP